jgi:hypothetical protein
MYAKLLPSDKALLFFACQANRYLYAYNSRVGTATSYHAVYNALKKLSEHDLQCIKEIATSPNSGVSVRLDNVQYYVHPRHYGIRREAHMVIGTAATAIKLEGFNLSALDILDKQQRIAENKRQSLTFDGLWDLVDHSHLDAVCILQWLRTLVDVVPELAHYKGDIRRLYNAKGWKYCAALRKSQIQPLPTNGKNKTVISDLAKSLREIFGHIGQTESSYTPRLILTGGDGLTYERMVQLKIYLQFHDNAYERMDILEPLLEIWHTKWTDFVRGQAH